MTGITCVLAGQKPAAVQRTAKTVTAYNNAQVDTAQSKFGGASLLCDGNGDYIQVTASSDFAWGTGDFTVEFWVRHNAINDQQVYCDFRSSGTNHFIFYVKSDNKLEYYDGSTYTSTATMAANTWYHMAVSRSGSSLKIFRDGTEVISATNSANHSAQNCYLGISSEPGTYPANSVNGWMDEIRVSNTARYTTGFTAPTAPFTNDSNTLLLVHCNGTDAQTVFTDDTGVRSPVGISAIGNAQVDTAQYKYGSASALFDGTGDYLLATGNSLGTNPWTVEYWVRFNSVTNVPVMFDTRSSAGDSGAYADYLNASSKFIVYMNLADRITSTTTFTTNTWYHIAVVKNTSNEIKLYINGTNEGATYTNTTASNGTVFTIGSNYNFANFMNGWMDEIRVSNTARYTANFTAPTAAFVNDVNTLLLIHAEGADAITRFTDDNS